MTPRVATIVKLGATICVFIFLKLLISYVALSSFAKVEIDAEFDHGDTIDLYYSSGIQGTPFRGEYTKRSTPFEKDIRSTQTVYLNDHVARKIRLDTGIEAGQVKLYTITLTSYYGPGITFDYEQIYRSFKPNDQVETFSLEEDHVLITTRSNDPYIVYDGDLLVTNPFVGTLVPAILAILFYIFISTQTLKTFPAFYDINRNQPV